MNPLPRSRCTSGPVAHAMGEPGRYRTAFRKLSRYGGPVNAARCRGAAEPRKYHQKSRGTLALEIDGRANQTRWLPASERCVTRLVAPSSDPRLRFGLGWEAKTLRAWMGEKYR